MKKYSITKERNGKIEVLEVSTQLTKDYLFQTLLNRTGEFKFTYDDEETDGYFIYNNTAYYFTYDFVLGKFGEYHYYRPEINKSSNLGIWFATNNSMWEDDDPDYIPQHPIHIILYLDKMFIYDYNNFELLYEEDFNSFQIRENISRYYAQHSCSRELFFTSNPFEEYDGWYMCKDGSSVPFELKRRNILSSIYEEKGFDIEVSKYQKLIEEYHKRGEKKALFICYFDDKTYIWDVANIDFSIKKPYQKLAQQSCSADKGKKEKWFYSLNKEDALKITDTIIPY